MEKQKTRLRNRKQGGGTEKKMEEQKSRWRNRNQGGGTENKMVEQKTKWRNKQDGGTENKIEEDDTQDMQYIMHKCMRQHL